MQSVHDVFKQHDVNKDGVISLEEFSDLLRSLDPKTWPNAEVDRLFKAADKDGNGTLDLEELLKWIFKQGNELQTKVAPPDVPLVNDGALVDDSESDGGASSSSSSSDDDEASEARKLADKAALERSIRHKKKALTRSLRHEEPLTTAEQLYEIMTMHKGTVTHLLELRELIGVFDRCKKGGMSPFLAHIIPQEFKLTGALEDLSAIEVGHLHKLTTENTDASLEDAENLIFTVKDEYRTMAYDMKANLATYGLANDASVGFGAMKRVLVLVSGLMDIDQTHLLATMTWSYTDRFLMTEVMAVTVMEKLFLKVGSASKHVLEEPVSSTNLVALFGSVKMIDVNNVSGISRPLLELTFRQTIQHMPKRLAARAERVSVHLGSNAKARKRHHNHKAIVGRTQLSVLFEDVYKAMEGSKNRICTGPLHLVLTLLERMKA